MRDRPASSGALIKTTLWSLIVEDFRSNRERLLSQGFWALLVYRLSHPRLKVRSRSIRIVYYALNRIGQKFIEVSCGISIPESTIIGRRLTIEHFGGIVIHGNARIGDDVLIRQGVTIGNTGAVGSHTAPVLGNRVQVGAGAKLIGGITIGDDVLIGANAVVIRDVPDNNIAVGVPAVNKPRGRRYAESG